MRILELLDLEDLFVDALVIVVVEEHYSLRESRVLLSAYKISEKSHDYLQGVLIETSVMPQLLQSLKFVY